MSDESTSARTVLILGAYGLIGLEIAHAARRAGHKVRGLGRDTAAMARISWIDWVQADLSDLTKAADWVPILTGTDCVINAAGALQDGPKDRLDRIHHHAIAALGHAAADRNIRVIQISAVGADPTADTAFLATKGAGDDALLTCGAPAIVLRPGLVMAQSVYGGTALLRMLAAVPLIQPIAHPDARVQVIGIEDLCHAVLWALDTDPMQQPMDLVSPAPVTLRELVSRMRQWLSFEPPYVEVQAPAWATGLVSKIADGLAWFGWRSPMRTTAMYVITQGVTGDPSQWKSAGGPAIGGLDAILERPATLQDRWHARMAVLLPVLIAGLALFWLASGGIGLIWRDTAAEVLTAAGFGTGTAMTAVIAGALADIALGVCVLVRPLARTAALGMIGLSLGYLAAGTIWTPDLWADPLGPFVKVLPGMLAAASLWSVLEAR